MIVIISMMIYMLRNMIVICILIMIINILKMLLLFFCPIAPNNTARGSERTAASIGYGDEFNHSNTIFMENTISAKKQQSRKYSPTIRFFAPADGRAFHVETRTHDLWRRLQGINFEQTCFLDCM